MNINIQNMITNLKNCGLTLTCRGFKEPYTIISETKSGKTLTIQRDDAIITDECKYHSTKNNQFLIKTDEYDFIKNDKGKILKIRLLKNNTWKIIGNEFDEYSIIFDKKFKQLIN